MQINQTILADPKLRKRYEERRLAAFKAFQGMPRGSKAQCAFSLRIHPVTVSNVLNGRRMSEATLLRIEAYLGLDGQNDHRD
jgi:hypothetical protein